ncbi:91f774c4-bf1f-4b63-9cff-82ec2c5fddd9 [Thermothielavioides terrestris]|uniref:Uncharacterized protein n=2 Tax=Thermothielavioides terrestris TaxID=2587410 RepID=G2QX60_THETT|nr:uncharacterized protein THITE_2106284 [Thermothielavioides terrestris NRRL 8126]AEO62281.1 hypothetical protein THITE_2106284 [Thermothielavioides terrestris NRRL 8126]SPQ22244.1 91f774c4-bf1f-4b63-9cff-82ec2c5fddd9 [Thermothielavioides terrestris]
MLTTRLFSARQLCRLSRGLSTLSSNPSIKVFPHPETPNAYLLSYLDTTPPNPALAIGSTTTVPPTPKSFQGNPRFLSILNDVLAQHAASDPGLKSQAQAFASPGGFSFIQARSQRGSGTGAGGASAEGGAGGAGVGGWVHLSDARNPPDFGRIAWPEDILGSVEVDGKGEIIGNFQPSGTYRIVTNQGILGLSPFLQEKLIARLREEEKKS